MKSPHKVEDYLDGVIDKRSSPATGALAGAALPRKQIWHLRIQDRFARMIAEGTKDVEARLNMGDAAKIKEGGEN